MKTRTEKEKLKGEILLVGRGVGFGTGSAMFFLLRFLVWFLIGRMQI